jgi:hypothetical protein
MTMAITSIIQTDERYASAGSKIDTSFKLKFTGAFSTVYLIQNATSIGLPDYGDYLTGTSSEMFVSDTSATIVPGALYVGTTAQNAVCMYNATFTNIDAERKDLSPIYRPAVVNGGGIELTEVRRVDKTGAAMVNSAGDYHEGLPESYIPGSELTVSWNVATNPATLAQTYSFSTNSSSIWGQSAFSGVIGKITYQNVYEIYQGILIEFWRISVPLRFRNDGLSWNFQPLDYGYRYKSGSAIKNYVDPTTGVFGPIFLDGSGGLLNGNGSSVGGADPVIFPDGTPPGYETLTATDWSGLSCPINPFS